MGVCLVNGGQRHYIGLCELKGFLRSDHTVYVIFLGIFLKKIEGFSFHYDRIVSTVYRGVTIHNLGVSIYRHFCIAIQ